MTEDRGMEATTITTQMKATAFDLIQSAREHAVFPLRFTTADGYTVAITNEPNGYVYLTGPDEADLGRYTSVLDALTAAARVAATVAALLIEPDEVEEITELAKTNPYWAAVAACELAILRATECDNVTGRRAARAAVDALNATQQIDAKKG